MKITSIESLAFPEVLLITYDRFCDERGYFTETFNESELHKKSQYGDLANLSIKQTNESFSKKGTIRGLHFQWKPVMGKLVRTVYGHMVDIILDIRPHSHTFGKGIMYDMPADTSAKSAVSIWIPPGFAHGNYYLKDSMIEYYCSNIYNPGGEVGILPLSSQIDWSLCQRDLYTQFVRIQQHSPIISKKDLGGISLTDWKSNINSSCFE